MISLTPICHRCGGEKVAGKEYSKLVYYDHDQETCFQVLRERVDTFIELTNRNLLRIMNTIDKEDLK